MLDELDRVDSAGLSRERRRAQRYRHRVTVLVEFSGSVAVGPLTTPCRNISRTGAAFLLGRFVYTGTACRIGLVSNAGELEHVPARVVRCRHVLGTSHVYDVAVLFDSPIEVELFNSEANSIRALLYDPDEQDRGVLDAVLQAQGIDVAATGDREQFVSQAWDPGFDLVVLTECGKSCDESCSDCITTQLRDAGYVKPILSIDMNQERRTQCKNHGACRPLSLEEVKVQNIVRDTHPAPITSLLAGQPQMAIAINTFVTQIRSWIIRLRTAIGAQEFADAAKTARHFASLADAVGFDPVAAASRRLAHLLSKPADAASIHESLSGLVEVAGAVRPIRNGAAAPIGAPAPAMPVGAQAAAARPSASTT